jgi:hypothetical protein
MLFDSEARVERGEATLSTGAIVGAAVAIPFIVAILAILLVYHRQKRRAAREMYSRGVHFSPEFVRV